MAAFLFALKIKTQINGFHNLYLRNASSDNFSKFIRKYSISIDSVYRIEVKTDYDQSLYSKYITFTTLIDRFTSFVHCMYTGYEVTNL